MTDQRLLKALRIFWVATIVWFELGIFYYSIRHCPWPSIKTLDSGSQQQLVHVLVMADPQILDHRSYPDRPWYLTYLSQVFTDLNLRKSWRASIRTRPHAVVFLGDMMDSGRVEMKEAEYERYYRRFQKIFVLDSKVPRYFVPGNHDTGLGSSKLFSPQARHRYTSHFGPLNDVQSFADRTVVFLDGPGLVDEEYQRAEQAVALGQWKPLPGGTVEFIHKFAKNRGNQSTILFTHIPLSRPEGMNCGPLRERGTIHRGVGLGYQNTLGKQVTHLILEEIRPSLIFSGDDHDYCEYTHSLDDGRLVREVTVKSISMAMGIRRPGFQLLTLVPPEAVAGGSDSFADAACIMPDQLGIYLSSYLPLIAVSLITLLVTNGYHKLFGSHHQMTAKLRITGRSDGHRKGDEVEGLPQPVWMTDREAKREVCGCRSGKGRRQRRQGFVQGFLAEVVDIGKVPVCVFAVLNIIVYIW